MTKIGNNMSIEILSRLGTNIIRVKCSVCGFEFLSSQSERSCDETGQEQVLCLNCESSSPLPGGLCDYRKCLGCGQDFLSEGPWNRKCLRCRCG
jgi:hypothetical protein